MKIILALANPSEYIFLDEPVLGLDANHRHIFNKKLLEAYARRPRTFVIATHLIEEVASILEKVIVIKDGLVTEEVLVEDVLRKDTLLVGHPHWYKNMLPIRKFLKQNKSETLQEAW